MFWAALKTGRLKGGRKLIPSFKAKDGAEKKKKTAFASEWGS